MDSLDPSLLDFMTATGNTSMNTILEAVQPEGTSRINAESKRADRDAYIRNKYDLKSFVVPQPDKAALQENLIGTASDGDLLGVMTCIAQGAAVNKVGSHYGKTALHAAAEKGHAVVVEALCSNQADPNQVDDNSQSPLHICALKGYEGVAKSLLSHKADPNAVDSLGRSATKVLLLTRSPPNPLHFL